MPTRTLSAGQAHDQNNVLQVALSLTESLRKLACWDPDGTRMLDDLQGVLDQLVEMNRFTLESFLDSDPVRSLCTSAPDAVIERVATLIRLADPSGAAVEIHLGARDAVVRIPGIHLQQIVFNLVKNAQEAAPSEGGRVVVETRILARGGRGPEGRYSRALQVTVTDNGPGIPAHLRERVFEGGATTKVQGHGIGLHHARRIAHLYGGAITLNANLGCGSMAILLLPFDLPGDGQ